MPSAPPQQPRRFAIPTEIVEFILLGSEEDHRQLQDSPILGDVWMAYAEEPGRARDLLITPYRSATAAEVARQISERCSDAYGLRHDAQVPTHLAFLQGIVAIELRFDELVRILVPMTDWWHKREVAKRLVGDYRDRASVRRLLEALVRAAKSGLRKQPDTSEVRFDSLDRFLGLAGLLVWAATEAAATEAPRSGSEVLELAEQQLDAIADGLWKLVEIVHQTEPDDARLPKKPTIFHISRNRPATPALDHSVPAVKADAARTLFRVSCDKIAWAVLDAGIHQQHEAFLKPDGTSRVVQTYDFTSIREILSADNAQMPEERVTRLARRTHLREAQVRRHLKSLAEAASEARSVDWNVVGSLIRVHDPDPPSSTHGTHVAGILGGKVPEKRASEYSDGMCPDIQLYDFRVLSRSIQETEFAIIAALQYIRHVNQEHSYVVIHGANLSLSIPHNVRNYACGYTPICVEAERLVDSGVTVVAAAGNRGYQSFKVEDGVYEGYAAFSITDPGNSDAVITVGATHPRSPHSYGVSFFSSRGPTGDGRLKPDVVAPGERILAPEAGTSEWGEQSGTSMAAPHVSGAAAMLMARYSELIGQPRRIKEILCSSATDLGRERSFQGHGMLDVLRAFQSI